MTSGRDWVDALALRFAGGRAGEAPTPRTEVTTSDDERFSRATAVKLGLIGAAALFFGLGAAPTARAQDRGKCFTDCLTTHDDVLYSRLISCKDVFESRAFKRSAPFTWKRLHLVIFGGGVRDYAFAGAALQELCELKAQHEVAGDKKKCYEKCEADCRRRSVQSSSGRSAATCEATPPPHAPPPTIPPLPPNPVADACTNCGVRGGKCCYGPDPLRLCACATATVPCERYGCSS